MTNSFSAARRRRDTHRAITLLICAGAAACSDKVIAPSSAPAVPVIRSNTVDVAGVAVTEALQWNRTALDAVSAGTLGPPMVARALAIVHTAMFDAWAAYDGVAVGTRLGGSLRRPAAERTLDNKRVAVSYAAYRALVDLFPAQVARFDARMAALGLDPANKSQDISTPAGIGNVSSAAVLAFRHFDGANQSGSLGPSGLPYSDYTGYAPVNTPDVISDPNRWQPLRFVARNGATVVQTFLGAQWQHVVPFALASAGQFRPPPPKRFPDGLYRKQAEDLIRMSAALGDREKCIAEYWADGPNTVLPPGHWNLFAQYVSLRDGNRLDDDVQLFFLVANAVFDAGIAAWDSKISYDSQRPITSIHFLKAGQKIRAWAGPGLGDRVIDGDAWRPYQPTWFPTPPFAEYVSGHSAFSAAAAEILKRFTGSDAYGASTTIDHGSLNVEPGMPATPVTLSWATFSAAADEAGMSRRYGGIHFEDADVEGRKLGRKVGAVVWETGRRYIDGTAR
jgi:hypothetical protein